MVAEAAAMDTHYHALTPSAKFLVLGHRGLVGSAVMRLLKQRGFHNLLIAQRDQVDLRDQLATRAFVETHRPDYVVLAAAKVGGIVANSSSPYDFIYDNLMIEANVIESCRLAKVNKVLVLGSTCIYPRMCPQPMKEEYLLTGPLEPTNEWYAVAKIAGIKLGQAARRQHGLNVVSAMPTNLYGPNDNFDPNTSHVLPAMIRRFHEAKENAAPFVTLWGTGQPRREFLHVDDLAEAVLKILDVYDQEEILNVGCGQEISIAELAQLIASVCGYSGELRYDTSKPDGTPRKLTDITNISKLGWEPKISLQQGLQDVYQWYLKNRCAQHV